MYIREPVPPGVYEAGNVALRARRSRAGLHPSERELGTVLYRPRLSTASGMSSLSSRMSQSSLSQYSQSSHSSQHIQPLRVRPHPDPPEQNSRCVSVAASDSVFAEIEDLIFMYKDFRSSIHGGRSARQSVVDTKKSAEGFVVALNNYLRVIKALPEPHPTSVEAQKLIRQISDLCRLLDGSSPNRTSILSNILDLALDNCVELMDEAFHFIRDLKPLPLSLLVETKHKVLLKTRHHDRQSK